MMRGQAVQLHLERGLAKEQGTRKPPTILDSYLYTRNCPPSQATSNKVSLFTCIVSRIGSAGFCFFYLSSLGFLIAVIHKTICHIS